MDKFAVIRINGKQYRVSEGEEILVDKVADVKKITLEVLLIADGENIDPDTKSIGVGVKIGKPVLKDVVVKFKVLAEVEKGKKIDVFKYKAKSRERRHVGFRPQFTRLLVQKISN